MPAAMQLDAAFWTTWSVATGILNWGIIFGALIYIPFRRSPAAAQAWMILFFFLSLIHI